MKDIRVHDKAIVLILNKKEANSLKKRLEKDISKRNKDILIVLDKLLVELGQI